MLPSHRLGSTLIALNPLSAWPRIHPATLLEVCQRPPHRFIARTPIPPRSRPLFYLVAYCLRHVTSLLRIELIRSIHFTAWTI